MDDLLLMAELASSISLLALVYLGLVFLYQRVRDRRLDRSRYTIQFILDNRFVENDWVDFEEAAKIYFKFKEAVGPENQSVPEDDLFERALKKLALYEIIGAGIRTGIFDERLIYEFVGADTVRAFKASRFIIDRFREEDKDPTIFSDFEAIARRWLERRGVS